MRVQLSLGPLHGLKAAGAAPHLWRVNREGSWDGLLNRSHRDMWVSNTPLSAQRIGPGQCAFPSSTVGKVALQGGNWVDQGIF